MLLRAKIKINRASNRIIPGYSVCGGACKTCALSGLRRGQSTKTHKCHKTGQKWKITSAMDCQSTNVIYKITCTKCVDFVYIGQTSRKLCQRMNDHRSYIHRKDITKATGEHFNLRGHSIENFRVLAIEKVSPVGDQELIELRESLWISNYDSIAFGANSRE